MDLACLDDLLAGRTLPLLYAFVNTDPDSLGYALLAMLAGVALALALAAWRTERRYAPSGGVVALDAALCIGLNATLLFHKAHRLDRDVGTPLAGIPMFVYLVLLSEQECAHRLRGIALAASLLLVLPLAAMLCLTTDDYTPASPPPTTAWSYLFLCLTAAYASAHPCHIKAVAVRGGILVLMLGLCGHCVASLLVDRVGHGAFFTLQMAWAVMPSAFIHVKTLRSVLADTRPLMLAVAIILSAAYDSPVRFHAPAVQQASSWAVAVLAAAGAVDVALAA
jgi:hypothetical protein